MFEGADRGGPLQLGKPHQHRRDLGAGGFRLRAEERVADPFDDAGADRPAERVERPAGDGVCVGKGFEGIVRARVDAAMLRVPVQDRDDLLARDQIVRTEGIRVVAGDDPVLGSSRDRVGVPCSGGYVVKRGGGPRERFLFQSPEHRDDHCAGRFHVRREGVGTGAVHDAVVQRPVHAFLVPSAVRQIVEIGIDGLVGGSGCRFGRSTFHT